MQGIKLDGLDRRLIHCLQLGPRLPWATLAPVLGVDAVTLGRRWKQLTGEGVVYATPVDKRTDELIFAFLEIDCPPAGVAAVLDVLVHEPAVVTVDRTAGGRDLMATVIAESIDAIADWSSATIAPMSQVSSLRTHLVAELVADARSWRMRALRAPEVARVQALDSAELVVDPRITPEERSALFLALGDDFRAPASQLAERLGLPQRKVRQALGWLRATGQLAVRIDVARAATSWPVYVWYFLGAPASMLDRVASRLSRLPEMRVVAKTVGPYNVVLAAWLRTLAEAQQLESLIEDKLPEVRIEDRAVVLRTEKHVSHVLGPGGLWTGTVVPFAPIRAG